MKNSIYKKIMLNEFLEKALRGVADNTKVIIKKDDKRYGIVCGCGVQEGTYYLQARLVSEAKESILSAGQVLQIIDTQKEEAISAYGDVCTDIYYDFECHIDECVDNGSIYEKIGLDSIAIFLDDEDNTTPYYDRCQEAYSLDGEINYNLESSFFDSTESIVFAVKENKTKTKFFEFINNELRVFTPDGYIRITPKNGDGCPGVYVDLVSNKISEENHGMTEYDVLPLSVTEHCCATDSSQYRTLVWSDGDKEDCTHILSHNIKFLK